MEQHYQKNVLIPTLEERKRILEEKKKLLKPLDPHELQVFEQQYTQKREELQEQLQ